MTTTGAHTDKNIVGILVVDDDEFMLKLMQRMLSIQGYSRIMSCNSGRAALTFLDQTPIAPALIFLDLNMPEMDGIEFIRHLVARQFSGGLVFISGEDERMLNTAHKLAEAQGLHTLGHLQKPLIPELLAALLQKWKPQVAHSQVAKKQYSVAELHTAIASGHLVNYYQPKVALDNGRVTGVEVLVRWHHPIDGIIMPDQFIVLAEDNGLIDELAHCVLTAALQQHIQWYQQGLPLPLAINISMENLASLEFADAFSSQVISAGILPKDITLEITESRAMSDPVVTLDTLSRLRLKRFVLAIDDFGTGHSSLAQLRDIPFDEFKIDKSFVHRAWADNRVKIMFDTSLNLARQLGMKVVAEGVENESDWNFLRKTECDFAQGYFIARPMPAADIAPWLSTWDERVRRELFPEPLTALTPTTQLEKGSVLIVEDHEFQRRIQSKILRDEGYHIATAASGLEALNLLRTLRPILILMDIDLPDLGGLEIIKRLRSTTIFKHTPIVIVSGMNDKAVIMDSMKAGATGFLAKPYDRKSLLDKVKDVLITQK